MDTLAARMASARMAVDQPTSSGAPPGMPGAEATPDRLRSIAVQGLNTLDEIRASVAHLEEVCAATSTTTERTGCDVTEVTLQPRKPLCDYLDRRTLITMKPGARYVDVVFDTFRLWALFDTGANFSMITSRLARDLGLTLAPFNRTFLVANGVVGRFAGLIREAKLQLHDSLEVTLKNVRVIEASYSGLLLGTDVFADAGTGPLTLVSIARDGDAVHLTMEVARDGKATGLRVAIPLHRKPETPTMELAGGATAEASSAAAEEPAKRCLGDARRSAMPRDVRAWCLERGVPDKHLQQVWDGLLLCLQKECTPTEMVCSHCKHPHTDFGKYAGFTHRGHVCSNCKKQFLMPEKDVGNVLAGWLPELKEGKVWLARRAPKTFAGETLAMVASVSIQPVPPPSPVATLFRHAEQAHIAEDFLRDRCESRDPLQDVIALRDSLAAGVTLSAECCPRCGAHAIDRGGAAKEP